MEPFETYILKRILVQVGGVIAIAAILGVFILAYNATYNNISNLDQAADGRWTRLGNDLQERYQGIPGLAGEIRPSLGPDTSALDELLKNLSRWDSAVGGGDTGQISLATTDLEASLSSFVSDLKGHPELEGSDRVQEFLGVLESTGARASDDEAGYNEEVQQYNQAISTFPGALWAPDWGFGEREYFTARIGNGEQIPVPPG